MLVSALILSALLAGDPTASVAQDRQSTPAPQREFRRSEPGTMARFTEMEYRQMVDRTRRKLTRQAVIVDRQVLAERLDHLIGRGRCDDAARLAQARGYSDITTVVADVCETRASN
ncbi:hypothetical protein [Brevundimonas intermedia]|uniref:hypothetical protein n=1 Tax=Brevundimonas intermedia TaxID=74315 RepID=UPI00320A0155